MAAKIQKDKRKLWLDFGQFEECYFMLLERRGAGPILTFGFGWLIKPLYLWNSM
jgi:hypothetical protein